MEKEKIVLTGQFNGQNTKKDGIVDIKFKFPSDELVNCLNVFKFISQNLLLDIKVDGQIVRVGNVLLSGFSSDKDANVTVKLTGISEDLDLADLTTKCINKVIKVRLQNV